MNSSIKLKLSLLFTFLLIIIVGCSKDDDSIFSNTYTSEDLLLIHGETSKTWKLEAFYENYNYEYLDENNDCFVDDQYIFNVDNEIVEVKVGDENCYYGESEIAEATYSFYEETGNVFFTMIRGEITEDLVVSRSFTLQLVELEKNRMLFASGEKGDYKKVLLFTAE
ncbi:hypothetical protein L1I30_09365 [Gillisia sp. M10.2A]|uniref:Lipocalin-like domain-containing protein n=1 Tax=Gillisia lutea TaxID=2909668 RepID=A0ABS9EI59_9FLAO|nr:hypothetical protein [Gillisia lutea]MCF4101874.1 hypothetical protein [Gillisia lutea]